MTPHRIPDRLLLLYTDRADAVARAILDHAGRFDREVIALSLAELVDDVVPGRVWSWAGRDVDPARTAVVNRLALPEGPEATGPLASYFAQRQLWIWLLRELGRFAYASALPTPTSAIGGYGSLLDQWLDLPALLGDVRVPAYRRPWADDTLHGDVHAVDPWNLYSLGNRVAPGDPSRSTSRLVYVRPRGHLVHVAQVGGTMMIANAPPDMSAAQQSSIVAFANGMASRSGTRILEHAFFVGDERPVFYSTCPSPVITGSLADFPLLLVQGLRDDIDRRSQRVAS